MKNIEKYYNELLNQDYDNPSCYFTAHIMKENCVSKNNCAECKNAFIKWLNEEYIFELTDAEKVILNNLPEGYNYIARDSDGELFIYEDKPKKYRNTWSDNEYYKSMELFNDLFKFIKWEDDKPYSIEELLKEDTYEPGR